MDIWFSVEAGVAFVMDFLAPHIGLHGGSLIAFMLVCAALAPFYRRRHLASALENLVAGTIPIAVALVTGSLGGMLVAEFLRLAPAASAIPAHDFPRPFLPIAAAWLHAACIVAMVLGIGNAGTLFDHREARRR